MKVLGRYTGPSAAHLAATLPGSSRRPNASGWWSLRGWCHGSGGKRGSSSLKLSGGESGARLMGRCFKGCDRRAIITALEVAASTRIWDAWDVPTPAPRSPASAHRSAPISAQGPPSAGTLHHPSTSAPGPAPASAYALRLWRESEPIPYNPEHPARRWLALRCLWWPELPLPRAVRWLPAPGRWPQHGGAGAVVRLLAPGPAWADTWPDLPAATAVELTHVDDAGAAAQDRPEGLPKRSHGPTTGAVTLLGDPRPAWSHGLALAEGLADALALASRRTETAAALGGTSGAAGMADAAEWLGAWDSLTLWADSDEAGLRAARNLRADLARRGIRLDARALTTAKDAAEATARAPLPALALDTVREFAADLTGEGLPLWEAARLAALTTTQLNQQEESQCSPIPT